MEIVIGAFVQKMAPSLAHEQLVQLDSILREYDNDLYNWIVLRTAPPERITAQPLWSTLTTFAREGLGSAASLSEH